MHEAYLVGSIVLYGLWVKPIFILWCIALCLARRKGDPARTGLAWMKAVFPLWTVALIFLTAAQIIFLWLTLADDVRLSVEIEVRNAAFHLSTVGWFFKFVTDALLLVMLSELASGFLLCVTGHPLAKPVRFAVMSTAGVLFILSIVYLGLDAKTNTSIYNVEKARRPTSADYAQRNLDIRNSLRMFGSLNVLFWLASMPILGLVSFVVHKARPAKHLHNSVGLLLTCAILNFIRMTTGLAFAATYHLSDYPPAMEPYVNTIVLPVLDFIPMFVILVMAFTIGVRKAKGLWSGGIPPPSSVAAPYGITIWQGPPPHPGQSYYGPPPPQGGAPAPVYGYPVQPAYGGYPQQQPGQVQGQPPQGYYAQPPQQGVPPPQTQPGQQPPQELKTEPGVGN